MNKLWWLIIGVGIITLGTGVMLMQPISPKLPTNNGVVLQAREPLSASNFRVRTTPVQEEQPTTIQFFGDIMLDRNVRKAMATSGLDYIFKNVSTTLLRESEIKIANLEGPFVQKKIKTSKEIAFGFDPVYLNDLKRYGFTAFNLANNHNYDMGKANQALTRELLEQNGFGWFGDELSESPDLTWFTTSSDGTKIAFIGIHNTYHKPDRKKILAAISDAKNKADFVVVNVHWGEEYKTTSNASQQEFGHWFIDNGADVVVGHHPHVVEEMELYKDKPIFYSLGNFIFDQYFSKETQEGLSIKMSYRSHKLAELELLPFKSNKSQLNEMTESEKNVFFEKFINDSRIGDKKIINGKIEF